jgi:hypothetical protein
MAWGEIGHSVAFKERIHTGDRGTRATFIGIAASVYHVARNCPGPNRSPQFLVDDYLVSHLKMNATASPAVVAMPQEMIDGKALSINVGSCSAK